jgi:diguanylate cyclase (GGDEF)-like protein
MVNRDTALVVDLAASASALVGDALADVGLDLVTATSASEAVAFAAGERLPALVLVDLEGVDAGPVRDLATAFGEVPIIATCEEAALDAAFDAGATECVTKPIRAGELRARIRVALHVRNESIARSNRERKKSDAIVALQREKQDLEHLICVDPLTGLANRRHAFSLLEAEWKRSARERVPLGVVMIDLDCFHAYNEQYGHLGGDVCLQRVTEAMVTCLRRPTDFLGRYGGEEFIAVLPNTDAAGAALVAERLRSAVAALQIPHLASACDRVVTITAGFAALRALADLSLYKLIGVADGALLRAKAEGRNRVGGDAIIVRSPSVSGQPWKRFAPVIADPWFAHRIPEFLADVRDDASALARAARTGDVDLIRSITTPLKVQAAEVGLVAITRLAADIEHAADLALPESLRDAVEELFQYVTHVQVGYRRALEPSIMAVVQNRSE